jgi:hypothetical protein
VSSTRFILSDLEFFRQGTPSYQIRKPPPEHEAGHGDREEPDGSERKVHDTGAADGHGISRGADRETQRRIRA